MLPVDLSTNDLCVIPWAMTFRKFHYKLHDFAFNGKLNEWESEGRATEGGEYTLALHSIQYIYLYLLGNEHVVINSCYVFGFYAFRTISTIGRVYPHLFPHWPIIRIPFRQQQIQMLSLQHQSLEWVTFTRIDYHYNFYFWSSTSWRNGVRCASVFFYIPISLVIRNVNTYIVRVTGAIGVNWNDDNGSGGKQRQRRPNERKFICLLFLQWKLSKFVFVRCGRRCCCRRCCCYCCCYRIWVCCTLHFIATIFHPIHMQAHWSVYSCHVSKIYSVSFYLFDWHGSLARLEPFADFWLSLSVVVW